MAGWREDFFTDLLRAGQARGITKFDRASLWKLVENTFEDEDAFKGDRKTLKKHYRRATKMTELGRKKLLNALEKQWPGYTPPTTRKNAPRRKKHPGANGTPPTPPVPPPTPPPPVSSPLSILPPLPPPPSPSNGPNSTWRGEYCSAMAGGCGKKTTECACYGTATSIMHGKHVAGPAPTAPPTLPPPPPPNAVVVPPPPPPGSPAVPPPTPPPSPGCKHLNLKTEEGILLCIDCGELLKEAPEKINPECVACSGRGLNSKGNQCSPCMANGFPCTGTRCAVCAEWQFKTPSGEMCINGHGAAPSKTPPLEVPAPPAPPAKTYGPPTPPPPPDYRPSCSKRTMRVCFSITLKSASCDGDVVVATLNSYLVKETGFGASVTDSVWLGSNVVDLLVEYTVHITEAYKVLLRHELVADAAAKPAADLGAVLA